MTEKEREVELVTEEEGGEKVKYKGEDKEGKIEEEKKMG